MRLQFLGATETVTGSKTLVENEGHRMLVDCGLFQGIKKLRQRNWAPFPVGIGDLGAILLTHAHIDHTGYLPALVREGYRGPIYCTAATADLCSILLPDAAYLQEEEADFANRHGTSKHRPALPLYTREDADRTLDLLETVPFDRVMEFPGGFRARWGRAGHILGAAWIRLEGPDGRSVLFSGDIGRPGQVGMHDPAPPETADLLVMESTYGDRRHPAGDPAEELAGHVARVAARGGVVVIPAFAVGRAQTLMHLMARLIHDGRLPRIPVFLDSPMAKDVTSLLGRHREDHTLSDADCRAMHDVVEITNSVEESKAISARNGPMVVIAASGMATGGRVVHHLKVFAPDHRNLVLFSGYQAAGTRGAAMMAGEDAIKIHGAYVPVRAEVAVLDSLSAHADYEELLGWASGMPRAPERVFLNHGEPAAADALRRRIEERLGWEVEIPEYREWTVV